MIVVAKNKGETKESLFRKFTKYFIDENILEEVRNKLFYKKPSLWRKEKERLREKMKEKRRTS